MEESRVAEAPAPKPFIPPERVIPEFTLSALAVGAVLGILFAASSVYLGLLVGLTVSASIPIAVLSITIFRALRGKTQDPQILVNNIVQTTGSAGESIAAGVAFTLPSLLIMGFELDFLRVLLVALLGGTLGVLMMIPLRQGLIVKEHGKLAYPEGTACAQVLIVGEQGGTNARTVFQGFFVGLAYAVANLVLKLWKESFDIFFTIKQHFRNSMLSFEVSPPMLGVGYIIGYRTASNMMAGGMLAFLVFVPLITFFGSAIPGAFGAGITEPIAAMSAGAIRNNYLLYIGAGAVATGGFINLVRSLPTIIAAFRRGLGNIGQGPGAGQAVPRTEQDLSYRWVIFGSLALVLAIALAPGLQINFVAAILIVLFGFFFVTVSSRITGEIGSSSNPISGMTVATLLITCLIFVAVGWTGVSYKAMALTTAALVCVAASNGGTISQDLKTGFLVGATPRLQQKAILVGVLTSSLFIGWTLLYLNETATTYVPRQRTLAAVTVDPARLQNAPVETNPMDNKSYRVLYVAESAGGLQRGKYHVDEQGRIAYLVDPGVCGIEPRQVRPLDPGVSVQAPPATGEAETYFHDGQPYRLWKLQGPEQGLAPGEYLVDPATNAVSYRVQELRKYDAPKARLFALVIDGILGGELPWTLVLIGVAVAILMELVGVSSLPFAVGVYLPISTSAAIFVGGVARYFVDRTTGASDAEGEFSPGVLFASGLIAGGSIGGILQAAYQGTTKGSGRDPLNLGQSLWPHLQESNWFVLLPWGAMIAALVFVGLTARRSGDRQPATKIE
jgi:putative OPT family oligopeptide transporter